MEREGKILSFLVDDKAKIIQGRKEISFEELKKGMQVSIKYKRSGGRMIAERIKVLVRDSKEGRRKSISKKV